MDNHATSSVFINFRFHKILGDIKEEDTTILQNTITFYLHTLYTKWSPIMFFYVKPDFCSFLAFLAYFEVSKYVHNRNNFLF